MTEQGEQPDPFGQDRGILERFFGRPRKSARDRLVASAASRMASPETDDDPETVTVQGATIEEVIQKLREQGITEVDERTLRSSLGEKHPDVIRLSVRRSSTSVAARSDDPALLTIGLEAEGTITRVSEVDPSRADASDLILSMTVHRPGKDDVQAVVRADPPPDLRHLLYPGSRVPLRVDPADPTHIGIEWEAASRGS